MSNVDDIPFDRSLDAPYGMAVELGSRIARLLAPNPSLFTFEGTGVHIVGVRDVAVIDPGPNLSSHIDALKHALFGRPVSHILVTHTHLDHRRAHEAQILTLLADGVDMIPAMVARLYADVDPRLHVAAARTVLAHLVKLDKEARVAAGPDRRYRLESALR